jgi:hypothetical protein
MGPSHDTLEFGSWLSDPARRAALVVAHPAHEIRVFHWLTRARPHVYILTQGSRSGADSTRRRASERLIETQGASVATRWAGAWDRDLYEMLLTGNHTPLLEWTNQLAASFTERAIDVVVTDSWQYYNVAHDITYFMARLAAHQAGKVQKREITLLTYPVVPQVLAPNAPDTQTMATFDLDDAAVAAKRASLASIPDIALEAADIERSEGDSAHRTESFQRAPSLRQLLRTPSEKPLYETFGEQRVGSGIYGEVVRWSHVQRACQALVHAYGAEAEAA